MCNVYLFIILVCKLVHSSGGGLWFRQSLDATVSDVYCVLGIIFTKGNFDEFVNYQSTVIFF